jgi:hypothetical protein
MQPDEEDFYPWIRYLMRQKLFLVLLRYRTFFASNSLEIKMKNDAPPPPQEGHLLIGKGEVCIPLSTLMIILKDNSEFHLGFLFPYDL